MKRSYRFIMVSIAIILFTAFSISLIAKEDLPEIVKKIEPSVVVILTYENGITTGQASGFFISKDGDIITNYHVLQDADSIEVKTFVGKTYPVIKILAEDKEGDLIRISTKIPNSEVNPVSLSKSTPEVGERILVIGNPLGLEKSVSDGIVSAVREIPEFGRIIQITAPVSPGSSGSPLVNMNGDVIGIISFQIVEGQNLNFAIPSERIANLIPSKEETLYEWLAKREEEWLTSAEGFYYLGLDAFINDNYEEAIDFFGQAVSKNPQYAEAYFQIGYCYGEIGVYEKEIEAYKQSILINPDNEDAHNNLGFSYGKLERYNEAIECFKKAIRINPDYAKAHYNLGFSYGELGRYNEAVEHLKQSIRINPDCAEAHYELGTTYYKIGRYNEAVENLKQAIRINPDYADAHYNLGVAYVNLGRYNEAIESYKKAICINPDYADAHYNLGVAYVNLGRHNEAIESYKQAIRINPDYADAHFGLGFAYCKLRRYNEAIKSFKQAIRINPDYAEAHCNLGITYILIGDRGSALEEYKILKNLDEEKANVLFNLIYE